jgi:proline racemase
VRNEFRVLDAHVGGTPVRLILDGMPRPVGATFEKRRNWLARHADHIRRMAVCDPRGQRDLIAVALTEPVTAGCDAGLLFLDSAGYPLLHGGGTIAAVTLAWERGIITRRHDAGASGGGAVMLKFDTAAGVLTAHAHVVQSPTATRVASVRVTMPPSFAALAGSELTVATHRLRVDLACAGGFYAIVDSETAGIPLTPDRVPDLRRLGMEVCSALDGHAALIHPSEPLQSTVAGVVFTSQAQSPDAHLRCVTISPHGSCDRAPGVGAMAAVMSVLNAMGLLREGDDFVGEGVCDLTQRGSIVKTTQLGELPAVITEVEGTAWPTAEQTLIADGEDPLRGGFVL